MLETGFFPKYTPREKEQEKVRSALSFVRDTGNTKFLLLYGVGGTGKTYFVRNLPDSLSVSRVQWVAPIDLDDVEFWSLLNLKTKVAQCLGKHYFKTYFEFLSQYKRVEEFSEGDKRYFEQKENSIFLEGYKNFLKNSGLIPALAIDTVEAVRGISVARSLIDWLVQLPSTLIILSGRPYAKTEEDTVTVSLKQYPHIKSEKIVLRGFTKEESQLYLHASGVSAGLKNYPEELDKLVFLSQGHPLWLALIVYYLQQEGIPQELSKYTVDELRTLPENSIEFDAFVREILVPYRHRNFWHEAVLRLSILRQRMSKDVWVQIMSDVPLPKEISDWDVAWKHFLTFPWVRERASRQYITLHDAFSEELAKRYIPQADMSDEWRVELWRAIANIYRDLIIREDSVFQKEVPQVESDELVDVSRKISKAIEREILSSDNYLRQIIYLHYQMLADYKQGIKLFVKLAETARGRNQSLFAEFLTLEIQRFLPEHNLSILEDVENKRVKIIGENLQKDIANLFLVCHELAELNLFLGRFETTKDVFSKVEKYFENAPNHQVDILIWLFTGTWRNNLEEGISYLYRAIDVVEKDEQLRMRLAEIQYLIGFAYRNQHLLSKAKQWLENAAKTSRAQSQARTLAKTLNLLGYIYHVVGDVGKASPTVMQAIELQQHILNSYQDKFLPEYRETKIYLAWSYNTLGEINRYRGKLSAAQSHYEKAEHLFSEAQYYEGKAIALQALSDTRRRIALAIQRRGDIEKSKQYWDKTEVSIHESLRLYKEHYLDRELETAYRRYGRFLHAQGKFDEAKVNFKKGLAEAKSKRNTWEIIENAQELAFLAAELGNDKEFASWEKEANFWLNQEREEIGEQIEQWNVFPALLKIARGCLFFSQGKHGLALETYMEGYIELAYIDGYGVALYEAHRDRLFRNLQKLLSMAERRQWLVSIKETWEAKGLSKKFPGLVDLCDARLMTIDLFSESNYE